MKKIISIIAGAILCVGLFLTGCGVSSNDTDSLNYFDFDGEPEYSSNIVKVGTFNIDDDILNGVADTNNTKKVFVMTESSLDVFNISNINSPTLLKKYDLKGNKIYLSKDGKKLFIGDSSSITILDVTDPENPQTIKKILGNFSDFVLSSDEKTIFAISSSLLSLIDITDPTNPDIKFTQIYLPGVKKLHISDDDKKLYVMLVNGLTIIDISDKTNPIKKDEYPTSLKNDMAVSKNGVAILSGMGLVILDVSNPDNIQKIGDYENNLGSQFRDTIIASNGKTVFTINATKLGVDILDISNPSNPQKIGYISFMNSWDMPEKIFLSNDETKLFVTVGDEIYMFDVSFYTKK